MCADCSLRGGCRMRFDRKGTPRALIIAVLLLIAISLGFLADFMVTQIERQLYPHDYEAYVQSASDAYGVPEPIIYALIKCESDFDSSAVSKAGAVGLCQIMPDTFLWLTDEVLFEHFDVGMLYDPETNIRYGVYYLSRLYDQFGDWTLAFAAYNAGPGRVEQWLDDPELADGEGGLRKIPFKETRQYVKKMDRAWAEYEKLYPQASEESALTESLLHQKIHIKKEGKYHV